MGKYFLFGIILAVHIGILCLFLMNGDTLNQPEPKEENPKQENAPAPEPSEIPSQPRSDLEAPSQPQARSTAVQLSPYSSSYYQVANQQLPSDLQRLVSNCAAAGVFDPDRKLLFWGKNAASELPLASLTKMMTALVLMEEIHQGNKGITLETPVKVTKAASRVGARQLWLDPRETFTLDELLKCALIRSANDCAYLIGEFLGNGDYNAFIQRMNTRARQMGCTHYTFYTANGLPDTDRPKENMGTVLELAYLAECLWQYPEVMKWTSTRQEFIRENTKKPFQLDTTNALLKTCPGVNGMKTGMTNKAGYCLVATCERENKRRIAVVLGVQGKGGNRVRDEIARKLLEWSYTL